MPRHSDSESDRDARPARRRSNTPGPRRRDFSPPYPPSSMNGPPYASGANGHPQARFADGPAPPPLYEEHTPFYPPEANPDFRGASYRDRDRDREAALAANTNYNTSLQPAGRGAGSRPRSSRLNSDESLTTTLTPSSSTLSSPRRGGRPRDRALAARGPHSRRSSSSSSDSDRDHHGRHLPRGPIHKTKKALENTFTPSTAGLGVSVLGAIVGGLAASEIEHHAHKKHGHRHPEKDGHHRKGDDKGMQLISTIVGAAVGAAGANAIEKKLEKKRDEEGHLSRKEEDIRGLERKVWEKERADGRYEGGRRY